MSVPGRVREYDVLGIRLQSYDEWRMHFHQYGKKPPSDFTGS